ncbi:acyl-CoA thioesterase [Roseomonas stagni]|uniref:Acyl-CoA thioesterase n=1 Tax=Falsiroseomonas algicola TaxID=2716930 RepID=A0A6M1LUB2_9PROT|nr:thioesterase family protein [Falsiroseomonas algicola]NGM24031.1 acyl-CoA thioesterase [Falsiroseomonas algicola]
MTERPPTARLSDFPHHCAISTRWSDNDAYGHVNNVVFYSFFDTAVNRWLIAVGALDIAASNVVGLVVETGCRYRKPVAYPQDIVVGMRLAKLGTTSVRYELAVFVAGEEEASAEGHFTHVYVSRQTGRPVPVPEHLRNALQALK